MRAARIIKQRFTSLFRRKRAEAELDRELSLHLEQLTKENIARGMSESEARLEARREFGSVALIEEECRDKRRVTWIEDLWRDLVYTFRQLRKSPGFALTAVLSLALGIGANTAIFSLADAVLLRMLPVQEPQQLVEITSDGGGSISYPLYRHIRERNGVFSGALIMSAGRFTASLRAGSRELGDIQFSPVSGDYFAVLGVTPVIGRELTEQDMSSSNTAVIGYRLWKERFRGDPSVVGTAVVLDTKPYTIIGVAPAGFTGVAAGQPIDLWLPITWFDRHYIENPVAFIFRVIARRKPGISEQEAQANVQLLARQWSNDLKFEGPAPVDLTSASGGLNRLRRRFARPLWVLMGIVMLLLLCAAVNVANLLLVRASKRRREMAVRLSIGAGRGRLIRQLLTESFVLAGLGGTLGLLLAPMAAQSLVRFLSSAIGTVKLSFSLDPRMLGFTLAVSCAVALLFGLAPAFAATRVDRMPLFRGGFSSRGDTPHATRSRTILIVAQVAISCVLLSVAVLFARSLNNLAQLDAGFERENVLILSVDVAEGGPKGIEAARLYGRVLDHLANVPGVQSAALSSETLFGGGRWTEAITAPGFNPARGQNREAVMLVVSPNFFRTTGTRLIAGRDFDSRDNEEGQRVAIVNESMARYFLGSRDAVGRSFQIVGSPKPLTIAGVVEDARYQSLREAAPPIVYLPYMQGPMGATNLTIRTTGDPEQMSETLWNEAHREVSLLRYRGVTTQARLVNGAIAQDRMLAQLSGAFGFAGVLLVLLGLFGLTAYEVSRRTAEVGIRIALGAQRSNVVRLFVGRAVLLVGCGVGLGMASAVALMRVVERLVFGVRATEPESLLLPALALLAIGAAAAYWPARRAASVDPAVTLREQ
ncbi:MAG: ADOP family duplicated permease [Bryobacteraceae bacterium]